MQDNSKLKLTQPSYQREDEKLKNTRIYKSMNTF